MDWKKYMSFNISNKLAIIGSLKIFISLLGSLNTWANMALSTLVKKLIVILTGTKISDKEYVYVFGIDLKWKQWRSSSNFI